jgi:hypothetical protein
MGIKDSWEVPSSIQTSSPPMNLIKCSFPADLSDLSQRDCVSKPSRGVSPGGKTVRRKTGSFRMGPQAHGGSHEPHLRRLRELFERRFYIEVAPPELRG